MQMLVVTTGTQAKLLSEQRVGAAGLAVELVILVSGVTSKWLK
jgi:hypothetical protein